MILVTGGHRQYRRSGWVFVVGDVVAPLGGLAVVRLLDRQMRHERPGPGPVPVPFPRSRLHGVTGPDRLRIAAAALYQPRALGHVQHLAERMTVPGRAGAGRLVSARFLLTSMASTLPSWVAGRAAPRPNGARR